jgi:PAT family beta-lactamase induction signal transducer AmpG
MEQAVTTAPDDWRRYLPEAIRPYAETAVLASFFLGISSGVPYAMIAATLTTRLKQGGIDKSTITAFALVFFAYNFKFLWAWIIDGVPLPLLRRLGQRVSWMLVLGLLAVAAIINLGITDPKDGLGPLVTAAILVGVAGASYDIVIDAYRIEILEPRQLGAGSGMTQYGWRIGSVGAAALALILSARVGWEVAYLACAFLATPAMLTALILGEPKRHREPKRKPGMLHAAESIWRPFVEFFARRGAFLVLLFILLHKIGDTLANLTFRLLFDDLGFTNDEIALYDVGVGFWAYLAGIFLGGILYSKLGMKRSVLISLILMAVSNFSFALLAGSGHSNWGMAGAIGFENLASGIGGVTVIAYFSALCDLRFTAAQYALISAAASIVGRFLTGTTAGSLIETFGYVDFYLLTTAAAFPGIILFWLMMRAGLIDSSIGTAGLEGEGDVRAPEPKA